MLSDRKFWIGVAVGVGVMYFFNPVGRMSTKRGGGRHRKAVAEAG